MNIRTSRTTDYEHVKKLYMDASLYGGQFDEARDSIEKLENSAKNIFIAEENGQIVGTVSIIDDGRVAWLFRFATLSQATAKLLEKSAISELKNRGHTQVIVYSPVGRTELGKRYEELGYTTGADFTAFWKER